jgi:hypothetical protein
MSDFLQRLLGIERSPGAEIVGETRMEFTSLPRGTEALAVLAAIVALIALVWWLYRRDRPDLARSRRVLLTVLRLLTLLAVAAMLVEPVLITSRRETLPSHLAVIVDDSESMKFSDPYTDESRAAEIAAALKVIA